MKFLFTMGKQKKTKIKMFQEHCFIFLYEMIISIFPYIHWNGMDYADVRYEIPHSEYVTLSSAKG